MRKSILFLLILLLTLPAFAQIELQWQKSVAGGNLPTWFSPSGNTERGFAYNPVSNNLLVVSRNGGTFVKLVNANDGSDNGQLDVTGISGGTLAITDIGVSADGAIYASNLVSASASAFKIYRWANEAAAPTVAFSGLDYMALKRVGDNITVLGRASDNSLQIWFPDATNNKIYVLKTTNNGVTLALTDSIALPANSFGGHASVYPFIEGTTIQAIVINSSGKNATVFNAAGQLLGTISGGVLATGSTTVKGTGFNRAGYLASYQFGAGNENARVIELMGDSISYFRTYAVSPSLGTNANVNGSGDIDFRNNPDGTVTMFVLGTNNGFGAYKLTTPFIMNGRLNENYTFVADKMNNNNGFGDQIDVKNVFQAMDDSLFYLAFETKVNGGSNDGVAFFIDFTNLTGTAAGQPLGGVTNGGHLFGATDANFKMGFEVDYAFAFNPGGSSDTTVYVDAAKYIGGKTGQYLGSIRGGGATAYGPSTAGIFPANSIKMGYDNWEGHGRGFEISIPRAELGNLPGNAQFRVFAVVVSSTAYFSNVTVPGNVTVGNLGFNADFGTISGGPYYSNPLFVPVELTSFAALSVGTDVVLNWSTATETNNNGFNIERSLDGNNFSVIGFVNGQGQSTAPVKYSHTDRNLQNGTYYYRLRQIDFDGTSTLSNAITVEVTGVPTKFDLTQNYPNPFNPSTVIRFTVDKTETASLVVFNALGEEVATLFNGIAKAGELYQVDFSAKNLTSGIYFYTLKQGQNAVTRKMMMVK